MTLYDFIDGNPVLAFFMLVSVGIIGKIWIYEWRNPAGHCQCSEDDDSDDDKDKI